MAIEIELSPEDERNLTRAAEQAGRPLKTFVADLLKCAFDDYIEANPTASTAQANALKEVGSESTALPVAEVNSPRFDFWH